MKLKPSESQRYGLVGWMYVWKHFDLVECISCFIVGSGINVISAVLCSYLNLFAIVTHEGAKMKGLLGFWTVVQGK